MFFKKKKSSSDMRVFKAPSFCFIRGNNYSFTTEKEVKDFFAVNKEKIVIFHYVSSLFNSSEWAKIFSDSSYLVICGSKSDSDIKSLYKYAERVIYSPMRKNLSGVSIAENIEEAEYIISGLKNTNWDIITVEG